MFPKINALPGAQGQALVEYGNAQVDLGQSRLDVGWHIIFAFHGVAKEMSFAAGQAMKKLFEIVGGAGVGVFADDQASRGVLQEKMAKALGQATLRNHLLNLSGDFIKTWARRGDHELALSHPP